MRGGFGPLCRLYMETWQSPVYCTCLENRRSERVREFESHLVRHTLPRARRLIKETNMGTVYGGIPFHYDEISDDTLNDDLMEIMNQDWVKSAIKEKRNEQGEYPTPNRQETV